ncbi:hypothetical protein INR49_009236 [Caranx melampygus]|nr:hypothetical protein INR49_009236 [Caranx melampygus]
MADFLLSTLLSTPPLISRRSCPSFSLSVYLPPSLCPSFPSSTTPLFLQPSRIEETSRRAWTLLKGDRTKKKRKKKKTGEKTRDQRRTRQS